MGRKRRSCAVVRNKKVKQDTSAFIDLAQAEAYIKYSDYAYSIGFYGHSLSVQLKTLRVIISSVPLKNISWSWLMEQLQNRDTKSTVIVRHYFLYLIENNLSYDRHIKEHLSEFSKMLFNYNVINKVKKEATRYTTYSIIYKLRNCKSKGRVYRAVIIPNADKAIYDLINRYLDYITACYDSNSFDESAITMLNTVFKDYDRSLGNVLDYNDETFEKQFNIVNQYMPNSNIKTFRKKKANVVGKLLGFYIFIQSEMSEEERAVRFRKYVTVVLRYGNFHDCMNKKYEVVKYNIYNKPPIADKLLLYSEEMTLRGSGIIGKPVMVDFSGVDNKILRNWVKECFWYDTNHVLVSRNNEYSCLLRFLREVSKRLGNTENIEFTVEDLLSFKGMLKNEEFSDGLIMRRMSIIRFFFRYIEKKRYTQIDALIYRMLAHYDYTTESHKEAYTKNEILKLIDVYRMNAIEKKGTYFADLYELYYYIFLILSHSEIRLSNLIETKTDSLVPIVTSKGNKEYTLVIRSKNSGDEEMRYNITNYVKELILEVTAISENARNEAIGEERKCIFCYKRKKFNSVALVRVESFRKYHDKMCEIGNIRKLSIEGIRNTYEQAAGKVLAKNGYTPALTRAVTGHDLETQFKSYDKPDMVDFCQRFFQVEIGSIHISGKIKKIEAADKTQTVMNGCGHCELKHCILRGNMECFVCTHFVATLENIPYFEQMVIDLDKEIANQPILHEREFLYCKKRLCVAYLKELYELKG